MDEQDDTRLDNFLRDKLGAYRPAPTDALWNAIETRLAPAAPPPPPPRRAGGAVLPAILTGLVGVLVGWLLPHEAPPPVAIATPPVATEIVAAPARQLGQLAPTSAPAPAAGSVATASAPATGDGFDSSTRTSASSRSARSGQSVFRVRPRAAGAAANGAAQLLTLANTNSPAGPAFPTILLPLAAAEHAVQGTAVADSAAEARAARQRALLAEKRELALLQRRADSLLHLLSLGAEASVSAPTALLTQDETPAAPREVVVRREPRLAHRWLLALTAAPERSFLATTATGGDSLATLRRHHETGRTGLSAAVQVEYRASERVSVAAGAGYAQLNTELRLTEQRTDVNVRYTTTTTTTGTQTTITTTPTVEQQTTETYRVLRPTYHFLTVPVLVRYRLTPTSRRTRCWADAAVGAEAQLFRGGTQVVSADGRSFETQRVGASAAPFRPATLALTGALAVNYALTPRLAASVAPAVRWQTQSVYRAGTGLQQRLTRTGVQLGLHWML